MIVIPKMLMSFLTENNIIPHSGCVTQHFFITFGLVESYTLAVMAYDHHVATCNPIVNANISSQIYTSLISWVYIFAVLCASANTGFMNRIKICKLHVINHYFCDLLPLLKLACSNTYISEMLILLLGH
ncbi:Olfactory receptor [Apodemus speciosus]|uniref:Olfactory receptor n=1 Tax=Apodemus speciosus TaxID=105296 RepID=A0ABQ0FVY0_APOSI